MTSSNEGLAMVVPTAGSRLDQLTAQYDLAKAEADKAAEALKAITDGIKLELSQAAPGETTINLSSKNLARPLRMMAVQSWRVDAQKLKAEDPYIYAKFAKQSTAWKLQAVNP